MFNASFVIAQSSSSCRAVILRGESDAPSAEHRPIGECFAPDTRRVDSFDHPGLFMVRLRVPGVPAATKTFRAARTKASRTRAGRADRTQAPGPPLLHGLHARRNVA